MSNQRSRLLPWAVMLAGSIAAACSAGPKEELPAPDPVLVRSERLARLSYQQERPEQAAVLFRQALDRAWLSDDLQAVGDVGYNLSVAQLSEGDAEGALATAQATRRELQRRGQPPSSGLLLVEAVARYRAGDVVTAAEMAAIVMRMPDAQAETRSRAIFLSGLIADERDDETALTDMAATLASSVTAETASAQTIADRDELAGRLALRRGDPEQAQVLFAAAVEGRRSVRNFRGLARALALGGRSAELLGDNAGAADLYLRAGRSAGLSGDAESARPWLTAARDLARLAGAADVADDAVSRLQDLPASP